MNFLKLKQWLILILGGLGVFLGILVKYYFLTKPYDDDHYKIHQSLTTLYYAPTFLNHKNQDQEISAAWDKLIGNPSTLAALKEVSKALPKNFLKQTAEDQEKALRNLHQSFFLKTRQAAMQLRRFYIAHLYSGNVLNKAAGYIPPADGVKKKVIVQKPKTNLELKNNHITHKVGKIDYLIIGSGPAGSLIAHDLIRKVKNVRVVLVDSGPFVYPGKRITSGAPDLMELQGQRLTYDHGVHVNNAEVFGGGATIEGGLAVSPLSDQTQNRLKRWYNKGWINGLILGENGKEKEILAVAHEAVTQRLKPRRLHKSEIDKNNMMLLREMQTAQIYEVYQDPLSRNKSGARRTAVDTYVLPALKGGKGYIGSLEIIPSLKVDRVTFEGAGPLKKAQGVEATFMPPREGQAYMNDPNGFQPQPGQKVTIHARNVIVAAGSLGSPALLMQSQVANPNIGKGVMLHPSMDVIGMFKRPVRGNQSLETSVYATARNPANRYYFEAVRGSPLDVVHLIPGFGKEIEKILKAFRHLGGIRVTLMDSVVPKNHLTIDPLTGQIQVRYELPPRDKERFKKALKKAVRILFNQGARVVFIPSMELINDKKPAIFTPDDDYNAAINQLKFIPASNILKSFHMQGTNKMGPGPTKAVVAHNFKVWNPETSSRFSNLYVVDGSVFPESIGACPMQAIYTFAKLFVYSITNRHS